MNRKPIYITHGMLKRADACSSMRGRFQEIFGPRAEVTLENVRRAYNAGLSLRWLMRHAYADWKRVDRMRDVLLAEVRRTPAYRRARALYERQLAVIREARQVLLARGVQEQLRWNLMLNQREDDARSAFCAVDRAELDRVIVQWGYPVALAFAKRWRQKGGGRGRTRANR